MTAQAFHLQETPVLTRKESKVLVRAIQGTTLSSSRQQKLNRFAAIARDAYAKTLPIRKSK
jgi:hypothetical protein